MPFEVGKRYEFEMKHGIEKDTLAYHHADVVAWEPPLLKLRNGDGKEWVLNAASALFIRAKEQKPSDPKVLEELLRRMGKENAAL